MKKAFVFSFIALVIFSSCEKDRTTHNIDYLTYGKWYQKTAVVDADINGQHYTLDLLTVAPDCLKDDYRSFTRTGEVLKNEGLTKCNPLDPQESVESNWKFTDNETMLQVTMAGIPVTMRIQQLDAQTLRVQWSDSIFSIPAVYTTVYTH